MMGRTLGLIFAAAWGLSLACAADSGPVRFNPSFEGASLGRVEAVSETNFRVYLFPDG